MSPRRDPTSRSRIMDVLRGVFLFRDWTDRDLGEIAAIATTRRFERNQLVFKHGEDCHHLFAVLQGRVQMSRMTPEGEETVLARFREAGAIRLDGKEVTVLDPEELRSRMGL